MWAAAVTLMAKKTTSGCSPSVDEFAGLKWHMYQQQLALTQQWMQYQFEDKQLEREVKMMERNYIPDPPKPPPCVYRPSGLPVPQKVETRAITNSVATRPYHLHWKSDKMSSPYWLRRLVSSQRSPVHEPKSTGNSGGPK